MERAALVASACLGVGVERLIERRQVLYEVFDLHLDAMDQRAAREAEPLEAVDVVRPRGFDHEPDRARLRPLRRMTHMRRQQEHVALADWHVIERSVVEDLEDHFALDLVERNLSDNNLHFRPISMADSAPLLTAFGNDKGYEEVFASQVRKYIQKGDSWKAKT